MLRSFLPLALATALLCPLAASAQTPPAAPAAPALTIPAHKPHVNGKISVIDAAAKTVTLMHGQKMITLSVPDGTKIYKIGDAKRTPTGTFADLLIDTPISARTNGDETALVAQEIHIRAPKAPKTATP